MTPQDKLSVLLADFPKHREVAPETNGNENLYTMPRFLQFCETLGCRFFVCDPEGPRVPDATPLDGKPRATAREVWEMFTETYILCPTTIRVILGNDKVFAFMVAEHEDPRDWCCDHIVEGQELLCAFYSLDLDPFHIPLSTGPSLEERVRNTETAS